ncbi:amino acid adenylation domain-containing protein [Trichocoleus desertorum]|uniref:Amino acid adenylation domain-containing protein n=1 Tax=Trichocoleus desertorum GB2-A4 TaxID=2933944 RepID=A0ABV0JIZ6_9CYAN
MPKGVMVEHCSVANYAEVASTQYEVKVGDRILQCCSISFDAAVEEIFCTFAQGATLVLRSEDMLSTAAFFLEECQQLKITVLFSPTAFWHFITAALLQFDLVLPKKLRLSSIGGERALPERFAIWRDRVGSSVRLINGYGPTEATVVATMSDLSHLDQIEEKLPIGTPISGVEAYILDNSLNPVPAEQVGELYLGGVAIARGYLNQPQLTAERFVPNPFDDRSRLYRTGDLVRYRPDQQLEYVGRVDHQVKVAGGFRVELFGIEMLLIQHPLVQEAAVVATNSGADSKLLVAYVVFRSASSTESLAHLRSHLKAKLPPYMIPSRFVPLESLPLTPIGKVDRRKLASEALPAVERHNQATAR